MSSTLQATSEGLVWLIADVIMPLQFVI